MEKSNYKQVIVVRKDLNMTPGKLASQVSHASMAWLTRALQSTATPYDSNHVICKIIFDRNLFYNWIGGIFTKIILKAKNKHDLEKLIQHANDAKMKENIDYFCIRDVCNTELTPEEDDGTTLTCVGFIPMEASKIDAITKRYRLYR